MTRRVSRHFYRGLWLSTVGAVVLAGRASAQLPEGPASSDAILLDLQSLRTTASVLYIAAHPDDENTRLIAYFARGRGYRTGYLSLTRGDGGQDLLGPELGDELGVIRTQELLAARRIDGGVQFFSRARDFGFSKDYRSTLSKWDRNAVLSDVVRVIRTFQPDVIITRFSTVPSTTHGHHTASAVLAVEAFPLAGNPEAFPESGQQPGLQPWQPRRLFWNSGQPGGRNPGAGGDMRGDTLRGSSVESFTQLAGDPAKGDLFEGIDTTWNRYPGGAETARIADALVADFKPSNPAASVPALFEMQTRLSRLAIDPVVADRRALVNGLLQACLGLYVEATVQQSEYVPGETLKVRSTVIVRSGVPVHWDGIRFGHAPMAGVTPENLRQTTAANQPTVDLLLKANVPASRDSEVLLPVDTPLTQPYWLEKTGTAGMFRVDDPSLIGKPVGPPPFPVQYSFSVDGVQTDGSGRLTVTVQPEQVRGDPVRGEIRTPLAVIPPVSLAFVDDVILFSHGAAHTAVVEISASRAGASGLLRLKAPDGWSVEPASQAFRLDAAGSRSRVSFNVTAPSFSSTASIIADADVGGAHYSSRRIEINYEHIPRQLLQPPAELKALSLDLAILSKNVGYIPGAGDLVAESLRRMGCHVTVLEGADLTPERLHGLDAVVIGIRAFTHRPDPAPSRPLCLRRGGRNRGRAIQHPQRAENPHPRPLRPAALARPSQPPRDR